MCSVFSQAYNEAYAEPSYEGYESYYSQPAPQPWVLLFIFIFSSSLVETFHLISMNLFIHFQVATTKFNILAHDFSEAMQFFSCLALIKILYKTAFV